MKRCLLLIIALLSLWDGSIARTEPARAGHFIAFNTSHTQLMDQFNYGLSHPGLVLSATYELKYSLQGFDLGYQAGLGAGIGSNKGVGILLRLQPLYGYAGIPVLKKPVANVRFGPYISAYYMWQLYPELQSGHLFWFSSYELGPIIMGTIALNKRVLEFSASWALAGLHSRPEYTTEQYYYSSTLTDFFSNPHTNLSAGFPGTFNHIELLMELARPGRKMSLGYEFEYIGYGKIPSFRYMTNSLSLKWKIKTKNQ